MEVKASARYIRMSPKKVRLVLGVVKGMDAGEALEQLRFLNKRATGPVIKLLNSAVANATHNLGLEKSNLYIKEIVAGLGPTLKRWKPRAFGRATPIRKKTSHISVVLAEKKPTKQVKKKETKVEAPVAVKDFEKAAKQAKKEEQKAEIEPKAKEKKAKAVEEKRMPEKGRKEQLEQLRKKEKRGIFRKIFSRKTGSS
ncbi:50S ribosomal protein L22 [Patescibacteria group bacterium]|nr:50S ribosomal protein L22 [Patescibacteria group bacterium]MBU4512671.1 50S ribosomal protein L22 [Patescibacteria group bacterium]